MESNNTNNKVKFRKTESRIMVAGNYGPEIIGRCQSKVQTFIYKLNKFWGSNAQHGDYSK